MNPFSAHDVLQHRLKADALGMEITHASTQALNILALTAIEPRVLPFALLPLGQALIASCKLDAAEEEFNQSLEIT